jgi:tRNA(Ile2) C34 agmatinyltransferase TiaS
MNRFEKNNFCAYCNKEMESAYRSKKYCSAKCRVYYSREIANKSKEDAISINEKNAPYDPFERLKELQKLKNK